MAPRVDSPLLLVGSLPAADTETAFRAGAELFGELVFALPDGETGPRAAWVGYERERLCRPAEGVVVVSETESPTGIPRHAYETPVFAVADGAASIGTSASSIRSAARRTSSRVSTNHARWCSRPLPPAWSAV